MWAPDREAVTKSISGTPVATAEQKKKKLSPNDTLQAVAAAVSKLCFFCQIGLARFIIWGRGKFQEVLCFCTCFLSLGNAAD